MHGKIKKETKKKKGKKINTLVSADEMEASSTVQDLFPGEFSISYADGSAAAGDYITDDISFGGVTIPNLIAGLAYQSNTSYGLMGVGLPFNEAVVTANLSAQSSISQATAAEALEYPNVPLALVDNNVTNTASFSLWLNDLGEFPWIASPSHRTQLVGNLLD